MEINLNDNVKEIAPKIYDDGVKSAVKEVGITLSVIPKTINAALVPLRKWIVEKEYSFKETEALLAKKLEKVKVENIVEPEAYIAVPAMESLSYCMNNDELRNLYANLLANSMNKETKGKVHPSFVTIIKQMSPNDAIIFKIICEAKIRPLITLFFKYNDNHGQNDHLYNISWISNIDYESVSVSIDNLIRMGLLKVPEDKHYMDDSNYSAVRSNPEYLKYCSKYANANVGTVSEDKQIIIVTDLGELFYKICVKDE